MAFAFGKADQREAPDAQAEFDEYQPDAQVHQGVAEAFQALRVHRLAAIGPLRLECVAADQAVDDHAQDHQHRAHQRLAQGGAGVASGNKGGEQRNRHQHQRWQVPESAEDFDGVA
ncbi:hypothetical protein D3C79_934880 [compost metagenome]